MNRRMAILLVLVVALMEAGTGPACGEAVYISEPIGEEGSKCQVISFTPEGRELDRVTVDGDMARVSPDRKTIAYLEPRESGKAQLAISDMRGKKIKSLPTFSHPSQEKIFGIAQILWSPDSTKIALLSASRAVFGPGGPPGHPVLLAVVYLDTGKIESVQETQAEIAEETTYYPVQWFPDNRRILFTGSQGTEIVDTQSGASQAISKDSLFAHLTEDGTQIIYISGERLKPPVEVWRYDLREKKTVKVMSLDEYPAMNALSGDGQYLVFQRPSLDASFFVADLSSKEVVKIDTEDFVLLPLRFSPKGKMIASLALGEDKASCGVYDLGSKKYTVLKLYDETSRGGYYLFDGVMWR